MTIDQIFNDGNLSVRSYNVCKLNAIETIEDLKRYYSQNKTFKILKNCGRKSDEELFKLCNNYYLEIINLFDTEIEEKKLDAPLKKIITELTRTQREVINNFIIINTQSLSVRSRNVILSYLDGNLKVKNFASKILIPVSFNLNMLKNIGSKSIKELEEYIKIIKLYVIEVSQSIDERKLISLKNKLLIQRTFSISIIPNKVLETESIFLIVNFLLNENAFFEQDRTDILKKALKIYKNQKELTLDKIAEGVNLTRERIRQIRLACLKELFNKLSFIKNFNDDLLQKYNIDINVNQIEINSDIVDLINTTNTTNLSREFITYILFTYTHNNFLLIGNIKDVMLPTYLNSSNRHNWNNFFLIQKDLVYEIDFNELANDIDIRISGRIEETYSFSFKSYLSKFLTNNKIEILDLALPIAEKIINDEFELYLDLDENLTFKRNTKKQVHEYAFEALEELGTSSKINLIFDKVIELNPNYDTDEASLRAAMARRNGFVPIGRNSVFGLKKWESELENFKGGTIKDVVIDCLQDNTEPIHISSILEYLDKFRVNKNTKSVLTNLKLDPKKRFLIYNQGFIGLKINQNKYSNKFEKLPIQLGNTIIAKHKRGDSINTIQSFLKNKFELNFDESILIINNLKYFNENKRN